MWQKFQIWERKCSIEDTIEISHASSATIYYEKGISDIKREESNWLYEYVKVNLCNVWKCTFKNKKYYFTNPSPNPALETTNQTASRPESALSSSSISRGFVKSRHNLCGVNTKHSDQTSLIDIVKQHNIRCHLLSFFRDESIIKED